MQRLILIVLSAFFILATPAFAKDPAAKWIVSQHSGDVRVVHRGLQPASVKANTSLSPGDVVLTGATGRATLARGSDYIVVAPRSELRLPAEAQPGGFTRVIQQLGTMLFKVKHTGVPHFAVDTPMLAAVVKGTTFTVIVDKNRSAVQVLEGAVQVVATDGGMQRLVEGGNTVFIDRNNPKQLIFATPQTLGAVGASSGTAVKIVGSGDESVTEIASLTDGLVRAEAIPAPTVASTDVAGLVTAAAPLADSGTLIAGPTAKDPPLTVPGEADLTVTLPPVTNPLPIVDALTIVDALPIIAPVVDLVPAVAPIVDVLPVVDAIIDPIVEPVVEVLPIVDAILDPIVDPVVEVLPIVDAILDPIVDPVVEVLPIVDAILDPIVDPVVEVLPIVDAIIDPIVDPVVEVLPIVEAIIDPIVEPVVEPIVEAIVEPVVEPIVDAIVEPVVAPVVEVLPVVEPIVEVIVEPIVEILPLPPLGLFGL